MRRIRDRARFERNQKRAARRSQKSRARKSARGAFGGRYREGFAPRKLVETRLTAPKVFSLFESPDETLLFFKRLALAGKSAEYIFIDLEDVERISVDALLLLLSKIQGTEMTRCRRVGGNKPSNPKVQAVLAQSGFYSHLTQKPDGYKKEENTGVLEKHKGKRVRQDVCANLIHFATKMITGVEKKNGGLYRTLIECMANTRDHATKGSKTPESWWVSASFDRDTHTVHFAFLDNGVGIFNSVKMRGFFRHLGHFLTLTSYPDLLLDVFEAKLGSRTGLPYRGKGLPSVRTTMERGQIHNLRIVTNTAYLDVAGRKGFTLSNEFRGTCLTWELRA